jgi:hypothetical protein
MLVVAENKITESICSFTVRDFPPQEELRRVWKISTYPMKIICRRRERCLQIVGLEVAIDNND